MAGLLVAVNGRPLASVSSADLNIIAVQVHGDVVGEEIAAIEAFGGLYGHGDVDKHLIWVTDHEISRDDTVEITFLDQVSTSHPGKTIEELYPESGTQNGSGQSMDDLYKDLSSRPKVRDKFAFELVKPDGDMIRTSTGPEDYSFHFSAMWKWTKPDEATASLNSNTLERIVKREDGSNHAAFKLRFGEKMTLRVST
jgi:hypothetical protein